MSNTENEIKSNFIRDIIDQELAEGKNDGRVHTRFPPEPNGYLHIGHAKSIVLNFSLAEDYKGLYNLRFDDTNPAKEEDEYVQAIRRDIKWLGYDWEDREYFASDYFEQLYKWAELLIEKELAYVDDQTAEEISATRGTPTRPGQESPYRNRSVEENLDLFRKMRAGEFADGSKVLRAKIDMTSPNMNMRDPVLYRILRAHHHRTGDKWCIYPIYDFTHGQSDAIEGITHSICTLEFENHRPLYNWFLEKLEIPHKPRQIEFAPLNMSYTITSKRKLLQLVTEGHVSGWDDPRMPTIAGIRRRGYTASAIKRFCKEIGVSKVDSIIDLAFLEYVIREEMNKTANRVMAVLDPLKVVITNYPEDQEDVFEAVNNPEDESAGTRQVTFTKELYIEKSDFMEDAPKKFFRLSQGREVRLKHSYYITCDEVIKDEKGEVIELRCSYDPESKGGSTPDGRKVKGTLHWVSAKYGVPSIVRLYETLFTERDLKTIPEDKSFLDYLNPDSLTVMDNAIVEPALAEAKPGDSFQFLRMGYFTADVVEHTPHKPVFNRIVGLKDSWAKVQKK